VRDVSGEMLRGGTTVAGEDWRCGSHDSVALSSLYHPRIHIACSQPCCRSGEIFTTNQQPIIDTHYVTTARKFIAKGTSNSDSGDFARTGDNATKLKRQWRKRSCKNYLMTVTHDGEGRIDRRLERPHGSGDDNDV